MTNITEKEFRLLVDYVKQSYGINLTEKKTLVVGRLQNILIQKNMKNFTEYFDYISSDASGDSVVELINKLTTNHTYFLREAEHFNFFNTKVLPELVKRQYRTKDMRIWSAGCSTGEEPYTLAMLMSEYFGLEKGYWDTKLLATDISSKVINAATSGIYLNEQLASLPEQWQRNYFKKIDQEKSAIVDKIKNEVIFRIFNLMNDVFPFKKKFHVIFCRNVMIYFDAKTKRELVSKFYDNTEDGGYLFIGHSESIGRDETKYKYIMPAVYRKE